MRRLTLFAVLFAFVCSCGGQWPILRCVAWVHMIREYSEVVPLSQAVEMTFSGEYPCEMCKAIAEKEQSDSAKVFTVEKHQKKLSPQSFVLNLLSPRICRPGFGFYREFFQTRSDVPPTPPPRLA